MKWQRHKRNEWKRHQRQRPIKCFFFFSHKMLCMWCLASIAYFYSFHSQFAIFQLKSYNLSIILFMWCILYFILSIDSLGSVHTAHFYVTCNQRHWNFYWINEIKKLKYVFLLNLVRLNLVETIETEMSFHCRKSCFYLCNSTVIHEWRSSIIYSNNLRSKKK